ncbi:ABC transporter substrate-binding protein [Halovivax limisalsi]|uniref:ABC transporter substrate-binding protein n=1 Tax=Halovivax limisalsi TaxID=1453760 RepID=UPI001FFCDB4F|nr:ABC transporter substrate-binding protein [Halovivax limisalsi]
MEDIPKKIDRRDVLQMIGVSSGAAVAGCLGGDGADESCEIPDGVEGSVETKYYNEWEGGRHENDMGYKMTAEPCATVGEFPVEFTPERTSWMGEYARMIARGASDLGLNGETVSNPFSLLVEGWVNKGLNYPVVMIAQAPEPQRAADPHAFLGRKICGRSNNFQNYCNPEMTELVQKQLAETDQEARMELVHEGQKLWAEDEVQGWTYFPPVLSPVNTADFEGFYPMPGAGVTNDYYPWSFVTIQPTGDRTTFIKGTQREMNRPNFMWSTSDAASIWMTLVWDSLYDIGPNLEVIPGLATSAEFTDDTTVRVELRDGVTWHDGEPFSAEDVVWTTEAFMDPPASNVAAYWDNLDEENPVEIVDDSGAGTVEYNLKSTDARFLTQGMVRNVMLPKHRWEDASNPADFSPDPPIGTGPFKWESWDPGTRLEFSSYKDNWFWSDDFQQEHLGDDYTEGPGIDNLVFVNTGNIDSTIGAMEQGDIDAISGTLSVSQAERASEGEGRGLVEAENFVGVNTSVDHTIPLLRDKEFRIAFCRHSWSVEQFVEDVMQGYGTVSKSNNPIVDSSPWYTDDTVPREYDIEKGKEILRKAGYTWNNGDLQYPGGEAWEAFVERVQPENTNMRREELGQPDFS